MADSSVGLLGTTTRHQQQCTRLPAVQHSGCSWSYFSSKLHYILYK